MSFGDGFHQTKPHTFFFFSLPSASPLQSLFPPLPQMPFGGSSKGTIIAPPFSFAAALITVLFPVLLAVKRLYFHPLSRYNGPPFSALMKHKVYGETDRVAPNEVSFINPDSAPTAQEPLVTGFVDKLIAQVRSQTKSATQSIAIEEWISFCTFDIICKLSFGEDFVQLASCRFYPWLSNYHVKRLPKSAGTIMAQHQAMTQDKVKHRLQQLHSDGRSNRGGRGAARFDQPDFLAHLVQQQCQQEISEGEMVVNAATLIHPTVLSYVTSEVRGAFTSPVPMGLIRLVPTGGHTINGDFFPEGTIVSYMQWAANVSPQSYTDPMDFHLERWLKSPSDQRHTTQPFLQGPRDGYGQNLARMDIVLILGNLLDYFDLKAEGWLGRWGDQKTYAVWVKTPLPVRLRVREGVNRSLLDILSCF
ncbi:cytochrome P450 [Aspergillus minisclerotigenes]|uniref:Cytochrome P450 n=1 Tax=Aspergillus minisclerotigenes TaxID=656917 RepID=A0A5N6JL81_9EURO|nr:cytochrome P450 [Aspergillus minisclerotigenes]